MTCICLWDLYFTGRASRLRFIFLSQWSHQRVKTKFVFIFQNWFFLSRFCICWEKYGDLIPHSWLLVMLLQLILLILFAEQVNQRNFLTKGSPLILPLVCLLLFSFANFHVPGTPFCKSRILSQMWHCWTLCSVQFLKTAVVIVLFHLMAEDITQ